MRAATGSRNPVRPWSGVAAVGGAVGAGPQVAAVVAAAVGPSGEGLHPVMSSAQAGQVRSGGLPGWSAVVEGDVGLHVVLVAAAGVDGAAGEDTVPIAQDHLFAHRRGWVVGVDRTGGVQVQDRANGDPV